MSRRYRQTKTYKMSAEIAYLTGLLTADGCLVNNNRHINLTSKDIELIMLTQRILAMNVKISTKLSMYGGEAFHLQFSNVALYDFLLAAGLTPAKSKTIGPLQIPDDVYSHFLRGYFDGDGSIHGFWDKRWRNSLMYYTEYTSASPIFLHWLRKQNSRLALTSPGRVKPTHRAASLSYAKIDSRLLFAYMYQNSENLRLSRKFDRYLAFFNADPYASKEFRASAGIGRQATLRT